MRPSWKKYLYPRFLPCFDDLAIKLLEGESNSSAEVVAWRGHQLDSLIPYASG